MRNMVVRKRITSLILALVMAVGLAAPSLAAEPGRRGAVSDGRTPLHYSESRGAADIGLQISPPDRDGTAAYAQTDMVRASVVLEDKSALEVGFGLQTIANDPLADIYQTGLEEKQEDIVASIEDEVLDGGKLDVVWNLTLAANLISINVPYGKIAEIEKLDGVAQVIVETPAHPLPAPQGDVETKMYTSSGSIGSGTAWTLGYTGAGSRIAIIDTGIETEHISFDGDALMYSLEEQAKSKPEGWLDSLDLLDRDELRTILPKLHIMKTVRDNGWEDSLYYSEKVPFAYNYRDRSLEVTHAYDSQGEHGSHVAGIAAANKYIPGEGGTYDKALESVKVQGVAPDAQLLIMKVFGRSGAAYESDYMAAIEDAFYLGADVVNLSLGSAYVGFSSNEYYDGLLELMAEKGLVIAVAAGNEGSWAANEYSGAGLLRADDVSLDTVGSPASLTNSFAVASSDNRGITDCYMSVNDEMIYFTDSGTAYGLDAFASLDGDHSYVLIENVGREEDFQALGDAVQGKIAVCRRGDINFSEKYNNAMAAGAKALIVYNNADDQIAMDLTGHNEEYTAPAVGITMEDGELLKACAEPKTSVTGAEYFEGTLTVHGEVGVFEDVQPDMMSEFSSWGVPGSLEMKPEITAPGGGIYSVNGNENSSYENMSGTSMASPQVAGLAALMAQYIKETGLETDTGLSERQLIHSLLMSTAKPITFEGSGELCSSVLQQGAGLANVAAAIASESLIRMDEDATTGASDGKVKVELGDDPEKNGVYTFGFTLDNLSDETAAFSLSAQIFTQALEYDGNGTAYLSEMTYPLMADVSFELTGEDFETGEFGCDVDGSGSTDRADAQYILDYCAGIRESIAEIADINGDGAYTTEDAHLLLAALESAKASLAGGTSLHTEVTIALDAGAKSYLDANYPAGAYIEGYVRVTPESTEEGLVLPEHSIPILGYYGNWSDPSMFDSPTFSEAFNGVGEPSYMGINYLDYEETYSNYITIRALGGTEDYLWTFNPYLPEQTPDFSRAAINGRSLICDMSMSLIRDASAIFLYVRDEDGNFTELQQVSGQYPSGYPYTLDDGSVVWDNTAIGLTLYAAPSGMGFSEGDRFEIGFAAVPELYEKEYGPLDAELVETLIADGTLGEGTMMGRSFTVDNTAPSATAIAKDEDGNLIVEVEDNMAVAVVALMNAAGTELLDVLPVEQTADGTGSVTFDLSGFEGDGCVVVVGDYAENETSYDVSLNAGDEPGQDFGGRMFGFGIGSGSYVDRNSWLEIDVGSLRQNSDERIIEGIETVALSDITVTAAEYMGGYVYMAASDGRMYVAKQGAWNDPIPLESYAGTASVIRDMAYSYKDEVMYALGDGNRIFRVDTSTGELTLDHTVTVTNPAVDATEDNMILVTLAIDDEGNFYSVNSGMKKTMGGFSSTIVGVPERTFLYTWNRDSITDEKAAELAPVGEYVGDYIYSSHEGNGYPATVRQSMAWDHDNSVLYWASSDGQPSNTRVVVFKAPGEDGKAEQLNADDPTSGITQSQISGLYIVPENDTHTVPEVEAASGVTLDRSSLTLLEGAVFTLTAEVSPWNLADKSVTWTSSDEAVLSVSENGVITALNLGTATVTAASVTEGVEAECEVTVEELPVIQFSALLTEPDGTSVWVDADTGDLTDWIVAGESDSYIAGTLLDDMIYVHDGYRMYGVDADNFSANPLTDIDVTWNWSDAAPAPMDTEKVLEGQTTSFGRIVGLVDGIGGGTSIAVMNPETGMGDDMATRQAFYYDRAVVIAYRDSGAYYDDYSYLDCPTRNYYVMTESGELWLAEVYETYDEWDYAHETVLHGVNLTDLGPTGLDLRGVSSIYGGQYASMFYDEDTGYLLVSVTLDGRTDTMYIVDPDTLTAVEIGTFGEGVAPVVSLYRYERRSGLAVKVRADRTELYVGESANLQATVYNPTEGAVVTWATSDESVASVTQDGLVTATGAGTAVITASVGDVSASCTVTVKALATAPAGEMVFAHFTRADGTGFWGALNLTDLEIFEHAEDDRDYGGGAAHDGSIYASDGIWFTKLDRYSHAVEDRVAIVGDWQMLDGTTAVGDTFTFTYYDEDWREQTMEAEIPGALVYISEGDMIVVVGDYTDEATFIGSPLLGYYPAAVTWMGNRVSQQYEEYNEQSYIQEWFVLGSDGYLYRVLRRTYVYVGEDGARVVTSDLSAPEPLANLGIEFADRTKLSMTRVKGEGYDGLLISDASTADSAGGTTLYWLDLPYGTDYIDPSLFAKLGVLDGVTDVVGLYTNAEIDGSFVDVSAGGDEGGDDEYQLGYDDGIAESQYIESIANVYEEYVDLFIDSYETAYYESYWASYEYGYEDGLYELEAEYSLTSSCDMAEEYPVMPMSGGTYDEGFEEGYRTGVIEVASRLGEEAGEVGYEKGYDDAVNGRESNPEPPAVDWDSMSAAFSESADFGRMQLNGRRTVGTVSVLSVVPKDASGEEDYSTAVSGYVTLEGSASGGSATAALYAEGSTNGLVTVRYDPSVLAFTGIASQDGDVLCSVYNSSENGTVTVAYASAGGFTGGAVTLGFAYARGQSETETGISLTAAELGGDVYETEAELDSIVIVLPYAAVIPDIPAAPDASVTTDNVPENDTESVETTARPGAVVNNGVTSAEVSGTMADEIVKQASQNESSTIVIAPKISEGVSAAEVTIPGDTFARLADNTDADLRTETPAGDAVISNSAFETLGEGETVTVGVKKDGDTVTVEVAVDGVPLESIPGGIRARLPELGEGEVAVSVSADGTETVIAKSLVENGVAYVVLDGSATVKIVYNGKDYEDVSSGQWYEDSVNMVASHEIMLGVSENKFAPDEGMTRAMMAAILHRLEGERKAGASAAFSDIAADAWYVESAAWAAENGIINGYGDGSFGPNRDVTREELVVMLCRYAEFAGVDISAAADLTEFEDAGSTSPWAKDAMSWAVSAGLINGMDKTHLAPDETATRAQIAAITERLIRLLVK